MFTHCHIVVPCPSDDEFNDSFSALMRIASSNREDYVKEIPSATPKQIDDL